LDAEASFSATCYTYWPERKEALKLWHAKLAQLQAGDAEEIAV